MKKINILGGVVTLGGDVVEADNAIRLNLEPYHQRIYELEGRINHIEQAYIATDKLRMEYQLEIEALHDAVRALERCGGGTPSLNLFRELVDLVNKQRKTNQK